MTRLAKGNLRTIVLNDNDVKSYLQAGWTIVEEPKVEEVVEDKKVEKAIVEKAKDDKKKTDSKSIKK